MNKTRRIIQLTFYYSQLILLFLSSSNPQGWGYTNEAHLHGLKSSDLKKHFTESHRATKEETDGATIEPQPLKIPSSPFPGSPSLTQQTDRDIENLRQELRLPLPPVLQAPPLAAVSAPASSALSPTAFGASFGQGFLGTAFQARTRFTNSSDGSISAGFGLGDAQKLLGVQVNVTVLNLLNNREGREDTAFNRGGISLKLHRRFADDWAIAVGVENAIVWGFTDAGSSAYAVASKIFRLKENPAEPFSRLTLSVGAGNGRFRSQPDFQAGADSVGVFASAGLRVAEPISAIADWNGQDLTLGASIVPFRNVPLVITPAFTDLTGTAGDGARFFLSIGYSYSFSF